MWWEKLFFGLLIAGGANMLALGVRTILKSRNARAWPQVPAKILVSAVRKAGFLKFEPDVRYSYSCEGDEWESWRVRLYPLWFPLRAPASEIVARYIPGQSAVAFVNPSDPDEAVLEPGLQLWSLKVFFYGLFALCAGAYLLARDLGVFAKH